MRPPRTALVSGKYCSRAAIGNADRAARELIHRANLDPRAVPRDVHAPAAADDQRAVPAAVPRRAEPRLEVVRVGAAVAADEAVETPEVGIVQRPPVEVVQPQVQIDVVAKPGVEPESDCRGANRSARTGRFPATGT